MLVLMALLLIGLNFSLNAQFNPNPKHIMTPNSSSLEKDASRNRNMLSTLALDINDARSPMDDKLGILTTYQNVIYPFLKKIIVGLKDDNLDFSLVDSNSVEMLKLYVKSNNFPKDFNRFRFSSLKFRDKMYTVSFLLDRKYNGEMLLSYEDNIYKLMAISVTEEPFSDIK